MQLLMITDRVPMRKCLQGYNEVALYCNNEYDFDFFFVHQHIGGKVAITNS